MRLSSGLRRALYPLLLPLGIAFVAGCGSEDRTPGRPGGRAGTLKVYTATYEDGRSENQFFLKIGDQETRLIFDVEPDVMPGTDIEVWGKDQEDGLHVADMKVDQTASTVSEALINAMPYPAKKFAFVFVDIGGGINITKAEATKRMFGTNMGDGSVKQYYLEASYNTQDVSGDVYGPFSYPMVGCDTTGLASTLKANGMIPMVDHYLWYLGSRNSSCGWSGLAESGAPAGGGTGRVANDTWYNASAGCVVLVQEPGHNFGMQHSSSMTCGSASFADTPQGTCTHNEYGDKYDPMGGACNHMNAWQKTLQGWLKGCNILRIKSSGSYTLLPFEPQCDGAQVLQIPMPKVRPFTRSGGGGTSTNEQLAFYYLELRTARGFDSTIRSAPTVLVHVAEELRDRTKAGRHTWILDMDPTTKNTIEGLTAGKSFTDPGDPGTTFKVDALSADQATITVTLPNGTGGPTCMDGTPQPTPPNTSCTGIAVGPGGTGGAGGAGGMGGMGGMGGASSAPPRAEDLTLVNADTEMDIQEVTEASTLNLDILPPNLTARVDTDPPMVGSVSIQVDGGQARVENTAPYSVTPHPTPTDYTPWALAPGSHTVTATPWSGPNATGTVGVPLTRTFTLFRSAPMGTGGAPGTGGVPLGTGGTTAVGTGGLPAGGMPAFGAAGTAGFNGFSGFGGGAALNGDDSGGGTSCGCRLADRPTSGTKQLGLVALAAGLMLARRRRGLKA